MEKRIKIKRIAPMSKEEKDWKRFNPKLMRKGWVTWIREWELIALDMDVPCCHPEDNKWGINFDGRDFKVIE